MKVDSVQKTVRILELTEEERKYLHALMQNPTIPNETPEEAEMRRTFFFATKKEI